MILVIFKLTEYFWGQITRIRWEGENIDHGRIKTNKKKESIFKEDVQKEQKRNKERHMSEKKILKNLEGENVKNARWWYVEKKEISVMKKNAQN